VLVQLVFNLVPRMAKDTAGRVFSHDGSAPHRHVLLVKS